MLKQPALIKHNLLRAAVVALGLSLALTLAPACRSVDDLPPPSSEVDAAADLFVPGGKDLAARPDLTNPVDLSGTPTLPPASCYQRKPGVTAIQALFSIDKYRGLYTGGSGTHEDADATMLSTIWVYESGLVDTQNISIAMLVDTGGGNGLPMELPLTIGQVIELEGEYIPAATANAKTDKGSAAVVHFTHSPCGFANIAGKTYH